MVHFWKFLIIDLFWFSANMPSRFEVREYLVGWEPCSLSESLWFWLFKGKTENRVITVSIIKCMWKLLLFKMLPSTPFVVISAAFKTQVNSWNSSIYCTRSSFSERIRWQGNSICLLCSNIVDSCLFIRLGYLSYGYVPMIIGHVLE